jgi:hypothetical protein
LILTKLRDVGHALQVVAEGAELGVGQIVEENKENHETENQHGEEDDDEQPAADIRIYQSETGADRFRNLSHLPNEMNGRNTTEPMMPKRKPAIHQTRFSCILRQPPKFARLLNHGSVPMARNTVTWKSRKTRRVFGPFWICQVCSRSTIMIPKKPYMAGDPPADGMYGEKTAAKMLPIDGLTRRERDDQTHRRHPK